MADIKSIADELATLTPREINNLASVTNVEYVMESERCISDPSRIELKNVWKESSPKKYGMSLLDRRKKRR